MARKIVITSGKGGVGKTTICANLGRALAKMNQRVLLVDADIGLNNLDVVMGVENKIIYDLQDIVSGRCRARQALVQDVDNPNLYILPSNKVCCSMGICGNDLKEIVCGFEEYFDYIIIDCPAGVENGFFMAVSCSDDAVIVTTPYLPAIRDADKVAHVLQSNGVNITGIVINKLRGDLILSNEMLGVDKISAYLKLNVVGAIPDDDSMGIQLINTQFACDEGCCKAFKYMANKIHGKENKVFDCTKKYKGILGCIRRGLRRWV